MTTTKPVPDLDTAGAVLAFARDRRAAADAAEVDLLGAAVTWADLHPVESIHDAALLSRHGDQPLAVAGPGAPLVAEFCVAEFAAAVGLPTETGKAYLGEALELRHRLPRHLGPGAGRGPAGVAGPPDRPPDHRTQPGWGGVRGRPGRPVRAPDPAHRGGPAGRGGDRPVHAGRGPPPPGGRSRRPARPRAHRPGVVRGHRVGRGRGRPRRRPGPRHRPLGRCRPVGRPRVHRPVGRAPLRSARPDGPAPARPRPRHHHRRRRTTRCTRSCCTCTSPRTRSPHPAPSPTTGCTWPGWRTPARSSTPTRSAPGAATPTPR